MSLGQWLNSTLYRYQVKVIGATDAEMNYAPADDTKNWVNGYTSVVDPGYDLYNYGDAAGCPWSGTTSTPALCNNGWTQEDVAYVSWLSWASYPFPEIYRTSGVQAKQWQQLSLYTYLRNHWLRMRIKGPLTQSQACAQRGGCAAIGTDNTADQAWTQLWNALNSDGRTAQDLMYSSDIRWWK